MTKLFNDLQINKSLIYQMTTRSSMPAVLLDALNEHKKIQQEAFPGWKSSGLILGYSRPHSISFYTTAKDKAATAANLPYFFKFQLFKLYQYKQKKPQNRGFLFLLFFIFSYK